MMLTHQQSLHVLAIPQYEIYLTLWNYTYIPQYIPQHYGMRVTCLSNMSGEQCLQLSKHTGTAWKACNHV